MLMNSPTPNVAEYFDREASRRVLPAMAPPLAAPHLSSRWPHQQGYRLQRNERGTDEFVDLGVEVSPDDGVKRRAAAWKGMAAEILQTTGARRIEARFQGPYHLLVVYEQGVRSSGQTVIGNLPPSTLRDFKGKLTFVPAGDGYYECQEPRTPARIAYFYFDPAKMPIGRDTNLEIQSLAPRLFFEDATLRNTAFKLINAIDGAGPENRLYLEALGTVLAHELVRLSAGGRRIEARACGGLAGWQQRIVVAHIEEHLAERIPLATLARLVRLSPHYFCRAFKQSFGLPPHRYHNLRRIEQARALLAKPEPSVTDIAFAVGFSDTSSFTTAFRKTIGVTPTAYHRSLS
jgi:AraC family transcriptional regulator